MKIYKNYKWIALIIAVIVLCTLFANPVYAEEELEDIDGYEESAEVVSEYEDIDLSTLPGVDLENMKTGIYDFDLSNARSVGLATCNVGLSSTNSYLYVNFNTSCTGIASKLGMSVFKVQKKVWYGWKTVYSTADIYKYNARVYGKVFGLNVEHNQSYRVKGTHYALLNGTVYKSDNSTSSYFFY